ncbi:MAG: flagellar hook-associated protein FlgL [Hydrogenophilales bacterium]|nr:flagellar hook-associated protein FlgL [Hydrogenophilales bacterium]
MRISSSTLYEVGVFSINDQLTKLVKTQQQIALGRRILTPEDDPAGASLALENEKALGVINQYVDNIARARSTLGLEETVLSSTTRVLQDARQLVVNAGNPTLSSTNLAALATTLRSHYDELLGQANSKDGQGGYLFAGHKSATLPFTQTTGAGVYAGDQGQLKIQINASRQLAVSDSGQDVFNPGVTGSDIFATIETFITALNSGSVTASDLTTALTQIDTAVNNVLRVRASIGSRLNELDAAEGANLDAVLQYESTLSNIRDLDYTRAITDLTRQQTGLEAAQKSFVSVQGLNLFNFIS